MGRKRRQRRQSQWVCLALEADGLLVLYNAGHAEAGCPCSARMESGSVEHRTRKLLIWLWAKEKLTMGRKQYRDAGR